MDPGQYNEEVMIWGQSFQTASGENLVFRHCCILVVIKLMKVNGNDNGTWIDVTRKRRHKNASGSSTSSPTTPKKVRESPAT